MGRYAAPVTRKAKKITFFVSLLGHREIREIREISQLTWRLWGRRRPYLRGLPRERAMIKAAPLRLPSATDACRQPACLATNEHSASRKTAQRPHIQVRIFMTQRPGPEINTDRVR